MRLGKPIEHLQAALRATFATGPGEEIVTTIARQLSYFGYLTYDAIVWASRASSNSYVVIKAHTGTGSFYQTRYIEPRSSEENDQEGLPILVRRYHIQPHAWCIQSKPFLLCERT